MKSLSPSQPHAIIMVGIPGSGKSFFAEKFAETFHAPHISTKTLQDLGLATDAAADAVSLVFLTEVCKTKQSVIFDGSADTRADRVKLATIAKRAGYETLFIWVQTDPATAKTRSTKGTKEHPQRLTTETFDQAVRRFVAPNAIEKPIVISGKHTFATQAKVILKRLSEPRATSKSTSDITPKRTTPERGRRTVFIR